MLHGALGATIVDIDVNHRCDHEVLVLEVLAAIIAAMNHFPMLEVLEVLLAVQRQPSRQ